MMVSRYETMKSMLIKKANLEDHIASLSKERRSTSRSDCWFEAITQIDGLPRDTVALSNLSAHGALMVVTPGTFIPEEFQLLGLSDSPIDCRRIWIDGQKVGIEFSRKIDISTMANAPSPDQFNRPGTPDAG